MTLSLVPALRELYFSCLFRNRLYQQIPQQLLFLLLKAIRQHFLDLFFMAFRSLGFNYKKVSCLTERIIRVVAFQRSEINY